MSTQVRYEIHARVAVVTLDNPPMHVVNQQLTADLSRALDAASVDDEVRALVLTATGDRAFCAGSDIAEFPGLTEHGVAVTLKLRPQQDVLGRLAHFPKPTIAALNGLCFGGGLEIAVCCDLIVAEEHVTLASPEIKLGLFPSSGGTLRTTRRIGVGRAKELMLGAEPITAQTAMDWGLVNRVAATGDGLAHALAWASELAERPAIGVIGCKATIDSAFDLPEDEALERALAYSDAAFTSPEAAEGMSSFFEREKPDYTPFRYSAAAVRLDPAQLLDDRRPGDAVAVEECH